MKFVLEDEAEVLQMIALTEWMNGILTPPTDAEIENPNEIEGLLQHSKGK